MIDLLTECGEALYGPRWQSELARDLGVSVRTMQRWAGGSRSVPNEIWADLLRLLDERAQRIEITSQKLRASGC